MKKLALILAIVLSVLCFAACAPSSENAETKMSKKGYVSINTSSFVTTSDDSEIETVIGFAKGNNAAVALLSVATGGDYVISIYYKSSDSAKVKYNELTADTESTLTYGLAGKVVFYGTEQGVKDFKGF